MDAGTGRHEENLDDVEFIGGLGTEMTVPVFPEICR